MNVKQLISRINSVLEYNWHDELKDFVANPTEVHESHIFYVLVDLDNWINDHENTVYDYVLDELNARIINHAAASRTFELWQLDEHIGDFASYEDALNHIWRHHNCECKLTSKRV